MLATEATPVTRNLIVDYYDVIMAALPRSGAVAGGPAGALDFAPASGCPSWPRNKGIALRDAVRRAIAVGLVTAEQLSIVVLAPGTTHTNDLVAGHGGDGIVVSKTECLDWYRTVAQLPSCVPEDPTLRRERSLVMVMTGVLTAIDGCLVPAGHEIVVHGSGCYRADDLAGYPPDAEVSTVAEADAAVLGV